MDVKQDGKLNCLTFFVSKQLMMCNVGKERSMDFNETKGLLCYNAVYA